MIYEFDYYFEKNRQFLIEEIRFHTKMSTTDCLGKSSEWINPFYLRAWHTVFYTLFITQKPSSQMMWGGSVLILKLVFYEL